MNLCLRERERETEERQRERERERDQTGVAGVNPNHPVQILVNHILEMKTEKLRQEKILYPPTLEVNFLLSEL